MEFGTIEPLKSLEGELQIRSRPRSLNTRVPSRVQDPCSGEIARTRAYERTRVRTPRTHATLARPAGNYREPRRRSVPPIMITRCDTVIDGVSILCLRIAQKSSSISSEMKNASGKPRLLCNASRATDAAIISDCTSMLIAHLKYLLLTDR